MPVSEKTSIYFSVKLSLKEISYVMYVHALDHALILHVLMTQKSCAVSMRNAILGNQHNIVIVVCEWLEGALSNMTSERRL